MIVPDKILYSLFYDDGTGTIIRVNKIPIQREIFTPGLIFVLFIINLLEILTTNNSNFILRLLKSFLTIIFTYTAGAIIYRLLGNHTSGGYN